MPVVPVLELGVQIFNAIKALFGFKESLDKVKGERRIRMSGLFDAIAVCLDDTANQIRAGSYPAGRCQELLTYAVELPTMIEKEVGASKAKEIGDALNGAHEVERLFAVRTEATGEEQLVKLGEAAGLLRAMSNLLKL